MNQKNTKYAYPEHSHQGAGVEAEASGQVIHPLLVAQVSGSEVEMGTQLGGMVREAGDWEASLAYYPQLVARVLAPHSGMVRAALRPLVEWALWRFGKHREREYDARDRAFVSALGISPGIARYYQIFDVLQNVINLAARMKLGPFAETLAESVPPMCSTLIHWGKSTDDGGLRHIRNFDLPGVGIFERRPTVVFCHPKPGDGLKYGYVAVRGADLVSINAFNEAGISITTHNRFHRSAVWAGTTIGDLTRKMIKHARTLQEAEELARAMMPIASTYGIAISSAEEGKAISMEICADQIQIVHPESGEEYLAVTNHYVHPAMLADEVTVSPGRILNTEARYEFLRERAAKGGLTLAQSQHLLASHQEPGNHGHTRACGGVVSQVHTVQSIVIEPAKELIHVSVGPVPTGEGPWRSIPWEWSTKPAYQVFDTAPDALPTTVDPVFAEPAKQAGRAALLEASAIHWRRGEKASSTRYMEQAVEDDPKEPSYRLLLGGARLQEGRWTEALAEFEAGLALEHHAFYHGQLLLWAIRTAQQLGLDAKAETWRKQLAQTSDSLLLLYRRAADKESKTKLSAKTLKNVSLNYHLCELQLPL